MRNLRTGYANPNEAFFQIRLKQYKRAIADITECIRIDPNNSSFFRNRAAIWQEMKKFDDAIADSSELVRLNPTAQSLGYRADIWHSKGDLKNAIADINEAIRLSPTSSLHLLQRGIYFRELKENDKAMKDFGAAIQFDPQDTRLRRYRVSVFVEAKEYNAAILDVNELIRLAPNNSTNYLLRAEIWAKQKDFAKALADYLKADDLDPNDPNATGWIVRTLSTCSNPAIRDGKKALVYAIRLYRAEKDSVIAMEALASAFAELGDFSKAVFWQQRVLEGLLTSSDEDLRLENERCLKLYLRNKPRRNE